MEVTEKKRRVVRTNIKSGDVVVCTSTRKTRGQSERWAKADELVVGRKYRVVRVDHEPGWEGKHAVIVKDLDGNHTRMNLSHDVILFKKLRINKATE